MNLHIYNHTIIIYIQYKFHEIPFNDYKVMAEGGKSLKFRQSKDNNSAITKETSIKLHVYILLIVIYIQ